MNLPNVSTLATTSSSLEAGELAYCDDVTEHVYVKDDSLANDAANLVFLIVSTASCFRVLPSTVPSDRP